MLSNIIETPVLFLVFNRPDKTQKVFDVIKQVKPKKLYVAADGPRVDIENDKVKCDEVRQIVKNVDWDCEVKYLFHDENQGCSLAGKKAWDWLFEQEDEMIFIEDDGLVSLSFFSYCQELLNKYRHDARVAYIYGDNFGITQGEATYFFSVFGGGTYSMATWKRVYDLYEYKLESFPETCNTNSFRRNFVHRFDYDLSKRRFENYILKGGNTYDLQIVYLVHKYGMYSIMPNVNFVSNIGFDLDGSNTIVDPNSEVAKIHGNRPRLEIDKIVHPIKVKVDKEFDKRFFKKRVLYDKSFIKHKAKFYLSPFYQKIKNIISTVS